MSEPVPVVRAAGLRLMPQNAGHYHAACAVAAILSVVYVLSLWWRSRSWRK